MSSRYHNSIHAPVFPSQLSTYSALSGALAASQFTSPRRKRVPQTLCKTNTGPMCSPVTFDYLGHTGQGVSLADFSTRSQNALAQMITGANDQTLVKLSVKSMKLHVMWTGYEHMGARYNVPVTATMTRGQLGAAIAMQLWSFVDAASKTTSTNTQWVIHPKGFDKILLVALYHVGDDVWQADIAIDF
ncbi:hypothetical protein Agabi119p4_6213 [Agaricus bisporus var. burnettii]|uniref:Uncharacterized protein n=1 Tax=Agaricus bisporus var. burnettii TaxID=192524 RepID=A0A8H7C965_AGABI|nr:hypothetical protein Agabi119p4_6213 [Agaricus bisporus var. burnettii]